MVGIEPTEHGRTNCSHDDDAHDMEIRVLGLQIVVVQGKNKYPVTCESEGTFKAMKERIQVISRHARCGILGANEVCMGPRK